MYKLGTESIYLESFSGGVIKPSRTSEIQNEIFSMRGLLEH